MKNSFTINGRTYERCYYTTKDVAMKVLPSMFGTTIKELTYGELAIITRMLNNGWTLMPGYFEDNDGEDIVIIPNISWFSMWCDWKGYPTQYICFVDYSTDYVSVYNNNRRVAKFRCIQDMFNCMPQLSDTEPLICTGVSIDDVEKNLYKFDEIGFDDEIYQPDNYVFDDILENELTLELDKNKCNELKFEKGE